MSVFSPLKLKKKKIKNRFVRSATCEYFGDSDGIPDSRLDELYRQLAAGGVGTIVTGYVYVMPNGRSNPGQAGIYDDHFISIWKRIREAVTEYDSLMIMQLVHGGRQVRAKGHAGPIWAPSNVPDPVFKTDPQAMTLQEIKQVEDAFIQGAIRAEKAGFDGVQLHVAHGYLLSQFMSPYTNKRSDSYGGNQEKRTRIVVEIIDRIKQHVSKDFIMSAKINGADSLFRGLSIGDALLSAQMMESAGLDWLEVSGGMAEAKDVTVKPDINSIKDEGYFRLHGAEIGQALRIPVASVGGYRSLSVMEDTISTGDADLISLSRPFVREPDLANKFKTGKTKRAACVSCNRCFNPRGLRCWHLEK